MEIDDGVVFGSDGAGDRKKKVREFLARIKIQFHFSPLAGRDLSACASACNLSAAGVVYCIEFINSRSTGS
jgi:hypothetical protein